MRKRSLMVIATHCPHLGRTVRATRNEAIERLVACDEEDGCRDPAPAGSAPDHQRPFPRACPVHPSLAK